MPLPYCTAEDIARKIDQPPDRLNSDERVRFETRARAASQRWDRETGSPARQVRVGAPGRKATWETHDAPRRSGFPLVISLNNGDIQPLDASVGDAIEIRTGRDSYEDITDEEGDEWVIDNRRGQLKLFEYVRVTDIDTGTGDVTVSRGIEQTDADSHPDGATLQYVPSAVREAVAARAAVPIVLDDDARTSIPDDGQLTSRSERADELREQYRDAARSNSDVLSL